MFFGFPSILNLGLEKYNPILVTKQGQYLKKGIKFEDLDVVKWIGSYVQYFMSLTLP